MGSSYRRDEADESHRASDSSGSARKRIRSSPALLLPWGYPPSVKHEAQKSIGVCIWQGWRFGTSDSSSRRQKSFTFSPFLSQILTDGAFRTAKTRLPILELLKFFCWRIVYLQYCVSFRRTAKWFIYTHTRIVSLLFQVLSRYRLLQDTEYSSLYYMVSPCCLSVLDIVVCIR